MTLSDESRAVKETFLVVVYDVSRLTQSERDAVCGEATVQGEASDDHPDVEVASSEIVCFDGRSSTVSLRVGDSAVVATVLPKEVTP